MLFFQSQRNMSKILRDITPILSKLWYSLMKASTRLKTEIYKSQSTVLHNCELYSNLLAVQNNWISHHRYCTYISTPKMKDTQSTDKKYIKHTKTCITPTWITVGHRSSVEHIRGHMYDLWEVNMVVDGWGAWKLKMSAKVPADEFPVFWFCLVVVNVLNKICVCFPHK